MYKVVTKEDTIRIPAEYIRKDKSLNEHIDRLAASAFEGRLTITTASFWLLQTTSLSIEGELFTAMVQFTKEYALMLFLSLIHI